jgi:anti-anti-sigma factor
MQDAVSPAQGPDSLAVVSFPERVDVSNADSLRDKLLAVINHGAMVVVADMSATAWCDRAGADALARVYQRAVVNGAQLRLVVAAEGVRKLMSSDGLDRLVPIYTSLASAVAAGTSDAVVDVASVKMPLGPALVPEWAVGSGPGQGNGSGPAINPLVLRRLIDALGDGIALIYAGRIMLANRRLAEMFGYRQHELVGREVEALIPADLRAAHRQNRDAYAREPVPRPMGKRARLVGLARDGTTVPVAITLSPVPAADGCFVLAVIRATAEASHRDDLTDLVRAAVAEQARHAHDLLDRVVHSVFHVGLSVQAAAGLPAETAGERLTDALQRLDDTVHEIRDHVFGADRPAPPAEQHPPGP